MSDYRERDTVVVSGDRDSSSLGMILGILLVIVLLAAVWFFTLGPGRGTTDNSGGGTQPLPSVPAASQPAPSAAAS